MIATIWRVVFRTLAIFFAVATPSLAITYGGQLMAGQNFLDLVALAFGACLPILNRNRIWTFLTTPRIGTAHVFTLGICLWSIGVCLSAMSAIHWRATGHLASLNDGGIRVLFRVLYDEGFACMLLASGPYEVDLSGRRVRTVALTVLAVAFVVASLLYGDTLRSWIWPKDPIPDWVLLERDR